MVCRGAPPPRGTPTQRHPPSDRTFSRAAGVRVVRAVALPNPPSNLRSHATAPPLLPLPSTLSPSLSARQQLPLSRPHVASKALSLHTGLGSLPCTNAPSGALHSPHGRCRGSWGRGRGTEWGRERGSERGTERGRGGRKGWGAAANGAGPTGRSSSGVTCCTGVTQSSAGTFNADEETSDMREPTGPTTEVNSTSYSDSNSTTVSDSHISSNSEGSSSSDNDSASNSDGDSTNGVAGGDTGRERPGRSRAGMSAEERLSLRNLVRIEMWIEQKVLNARFQAVAAVVGSLCGAALCFMRGTGLVWSAVLHAAYHGLHLPIVGSKVLMSLIEAIDVYLIGTVMLIFGIGLHELFVQPLQVPGEQGQEQGSDPSGAGSAGANGGSAGVHRDRVPGSNLFGLFPMRARLKWMDITSLDELKSKLGHVIVLILMVQLFEKSKKVRIATALDFFLFSASTTLAALGMLLLSRLTPQGGTGSKGPPGR